MEGFRGVRGLVVRSAAVVLAGSMAAVQVLSTALAWSGFASPEYLPVGPQPVAVAAVGNGGSAVAVAVRGSNAIRIVDRGSTGALQLVSSTAVGAGPDALTPVDVNGDGITDLIVVANHDDNTVSVLCASHGIPYGNCQAPIPVVGGPDALAVADVNGDGHPDVIVAGGTSGTLTVLPGTGGLTLSSASPAVSVGVDPVALAAATLASGSPLVAVADAGSDDVRLLSPTAGVLAPVATQLLDASPSAVAVASIVPGQLDLVVTTRAVSGAGNGVLSVIPLDSAGHPLSGVQTRSIPPQPSGLVATDLDGNGGVDIAVSDETGTVTTLLNDGSGTLRADQAVQVGGDPVALAAAKLSTDGLVDLVSADATPGQIAVLAGQDAEISLPNTLRYNSTTVMTSNTQPLVITSTGITPLSIYSVSGASAPFSISSDGCSGVTVAPGSTCTVDVTFAPVQVGVFHGALTVRDNASTGLQSVALQGLASAP